MTYNIIACGSSAQHWDGTGLSIGVNDAFKWGHKISNLLVANHFNRFTRDRAEIIINTNPINFYTTSPTWKKYYPNMIQIKTESWSGILNKNRGLTSTTTSPSIAMHLAWQLGATKLILWGIDFQNHHIMNPDNPYLNTELRQYRSFIQALREQGVEVYLGAHGSMLGEFLTVYSNE